MATTTKSRKSTPTAAKRRTAKSAPAPEAPAEPTPSPSVSKKTYREVEEFIPALKAAKSLSKGNPDLQQALQLITHLAWKSPSATVGWARGTTPTVIAFADDIAVPAGTPIPDALSAALSAAEKSAGDKPQKDALGVLSKVIKGHTA